MIKRFVLIGIQGAGKSTQGTILSHQLKIPYLSTGHIFRDIAKTKSPLGRHIKETLNSGLLIPDKQAIALIQDYLEKPEYKHGYILDGFPRTLVQAKAFAHDVDRVIYIDLPEKEALWRIAGRGDTDREDETLAGVKKRIQLFFEVTTPVVEHYRKKGKLITVDGTASIEEINRDVLKQLGKELIGNKIHAWNRRKKTIIAIAGLPGSGKSEATDYLKSKDLPIVHFGDIINDYFDKHKIAQTEEHHKKMRIEIREKHGIAAFAILNKQKIQDYLKDNPIVVINGMRSYEEKTYLESEFPKVNIVIICIFSDYETRQKRLKKRASRSGLLGKERDISEVLDTNMGPTLALAEYTILNDGTIDDLHTKLENIYREIYFG